jgi:hypothetical protein
MGGHKFNTDDICIIPIRNQKETYISGYFQDIYIPVYEYSIFHNEHDINYFRNTYNHHYYEKKYMNEIYQQKDLIYNCFKKNLNIMMRTDCLNNYTILNIINNFDNNFKQIPFKINGYVIQKLYNGCTVVFIDFKVLNNIDILNEMVKDLNLDIIISHTNLKNNGKEKFYAKDYIDLCDTLAQEKYFDENYYDFLNNNIYNLYTN